MAALVITFTLLFVYTVLSFQKSEFSLEIGLIYIDWRLYKEESLDNSTLVKFIDYKSITVILHCWVRANILSYSHEEKKTWPTFLQNLSRYMHDNRERNWFLSYFLPFLLPFLNLALSWQSWLYVFELNNQRKNNRDANFGIFFPVKVYPFLVCM